MLARTLQLLDFPTPQLLAKQVGGGGDVNALPLDTTLPSQSQSTHPEVQLLESLALGVPLVDVYPTNCLSPAGALYAAITTYLTKDVEQDSGVGVPPHEWLQHQEQLYWDVAMATLPMRLLDPSFSVDLLEDRLIAYRAHATTKNQFCQATFEVSIQAITYMLAAAPLDLEAHGLQLRTPEEVMEIMCNAMGKSPTTLQLGCLVLLLYLALDSTASSSAYRLASLLGPIGNENPDMSREDGKKMQALTRLYVNLMSTFFVEFLISQTNKQRLVTILMDRLGAPKPVVHTLQFYAALLADRPADAEVAFQAILNDLDKYEEEASGVSGAIGYDEHDQPQTSNIIGDLPPEKQADLLRREIKLGLAAKEQFSTYNSTLLQYIEKWNQSPVATQCSALDYEADFHIPVFVDRARTLHMAPIDLTNTPLVDANLYELDEEERNWVLGTGSYYPAELPAPAPPLFDVTSLHLEYMRKTLEPTAMWSLKTTWNNPQLVDATTNFLQAVHKAGIPFRYVDGENVVDMDGMAESIPSIHVGPGAEPFKKDCQFCLYPPPSKIGKLYEEAEEDGSAPGADHPPEAHQ